ncbi:MAG: hypothetical protein ACRDOA_03025 [Streptosporangiaceae bacterium]
MAKVAELCRTVKLPDAEKRMRAIMQSLSGADLHAAEADLRATIESAFLKKRRQALMADLDALLAAPWSPEAGMTERPERPAAVPTEPARPRAKPAPPPGAPVVLLPESAASAKPTTRAEAAPPAEVMTAPSLPVTARLAESEVQAQLTGFTDTLGELKDRHIFQWSTYYRDWLTGYFNWFLAAGERYPDYQGLLEQVHGALRAHAADIFLKGYNYRLEHLENRKNILEKSLNGLQRFLNLAIEFYSAKLPSAITARQARRLRMLNSCLLSAILRGYSDIHFGSDSGAAVLLRHPKAWADTIPFLTGGHVHELLQRLERTDLVRGIMINVVPVIEAMDRLGEGREHMPLPAVCQLLSDECGLDIWLRPSALARHSQMIELLCYFGGDAVVSADLYNAARRGVALIVAPDWAELRRQTALRDMVITTRDEDMTWIPQTREDVQRRLIDRAFREGLASAQSQPLTSNFARAFPLEKPEVLRFFRVNRQSVRDLLRIFEARSGVRLWCSVRRSGKTTAGGELGSTSSQVTVVSQTCDTTGQAPDDGVFYARVLEAIESGRQLPADFVTEAVRACTENHSYNGSRYVLALDEYETLFGRLRSALRKDYDLRFTVVQPLLNQLVQFTRGNLLIFLGQVPDAHFLLMEQNQLAPHVQQDHFPLFQHQTGEPDEEFAQLVQKIVSPQMELQPSFVQAIFNETAGHPYLTVNFLADFVDWLIAEQRLISELRLTAEDVATFAVQGLRPSHIATCADYKVFRKIASQAMAEDGRVHTPWLRAVYLCLSEMVRASPETLSCSRTDFATIAGQILDDGELEPAGLLTTAAESNFLCYDDDTVRPAIPLLGRIAAVSAGRVLA